MAHPGQTALANFGLRALDTYGGFIYFIFFFIYLFIYLFFFFFFAILYKGDTINEFLFACLHTKSLLKGVYSKREEFVPTGKKFFPFRADHFSQGGRFNFDRVASPERHGINPP